jgi:hypothetical protein
LPAVWREWGQRLAYWMAWLLGYRWPPAWLKRRGVWCGQRVRSLFLVFITEEE